MEDETSTPAAPQAAPEQTTEYTPEGATLGDTLAQALAEREQLQGQLADQGYQPDENEAIEAYDDQYAEQHDEYGERKKPSGSARAKKREQFLIEQHRQREEQWMHEIRDRDLRLEEYQRQISQSEAERQAEAQRKRNEAHFERVKEAKGSISDFDRVLNKMAGVDVHQDLIEGIKASDKSPLLAYHLASNPDKLAELNHMSDRERARELGRLEVTLKYPTAKKHTTAPPPPTTMKGGAAPHANPNTGPDDMKSFASWLKKDLAARKRR